MVKRIISHLHSMASCMRLLAVLAMFVSLFASCRREPVLHLHRDNISLEFPIIDLELDVVWDYRFVYDIFYDWRSEWYYGDDPELFGGIGDEVIGYHKPSVFELRRYFTGDVPYAPHSRREEFLIEGYSFTGEFDWGFHDLLVWNYITPAPGEVAVSIHIDETTTLDSVYAYTREGMRNVKLPNRAVVTRAYFQPEELFSAYDQAEEIDHNLTGFVWDEERGVWLKTLEAKLQPLTYIYLTQIIIHNNNGRIVGVDGEADLSGMASSTNLNTGYTGSTPVAVNYRCRMKKHIDVEGEDVDIVGGRVMTFGICNHVCNRVSRAPIPDHEDPDRHYIDCTFISNEGMEVTKAFDVTDQVRTRFKGGVLTVHVDANDIEFQKKTGGSGFDAVIEEETKEEHEFEM